MYVLKTMKVEGSNFCLLLTVMQTFCLDGYHTFKVVPWFNARLSARWVPEEGFRPWKAKGSRDQHASGNAVACCLSHFRNHHSLITNCKDYYNM